MSGLVHPTRSMWPMPSDKLNLARLTAVGYRLVFIETTQSGGASLDRDGIPTKSSVYTLQRWSFYIMCLDYRYSEAPLQFVPASNALKRHILLNRRYVPPSALNTMRFTVVVLSLLAAEALAFATIFMSSNATVRLTSCREIAISTALCHDTPAAIREGYWKYLVGYELETSSVESLT